MDEKHLKEGGQPVEQGLLPRLHELLVTHEKIQEPTYLGVRDLCPRSVHVQQEGKPRVGGHDSTEPHVFDERHPPQPERTLPRDYTESVRPRQVPYPGPSTILGTVLSRGSLVHVWWVEETVEDPTRCVVNPRTRRPFVTFTSEPFPHLR